MAIYKLKINYKTQI